MPGAPLTDPGVQYSRTGLFNRTRCLSLHRKVCQFGSVYLTGLVAGVNFVQVVSPFGHFGALRLAVSYYELIRLPGLLLRALLVVETAYPLGSRSSCGGTVWGLLGSVSRLPRAPRS